MNLYEEVFEENHSDFDDRLEQEENIFFEIKDESEPIREDDLFYRHLEEY